jgi:hypothetical protein
MKRSIWIAIICVMAPLAARSQGSMPNPAAAAMRHTLDEYSKNLVATAQEMPAEKYSYHPTAENMTFGKAIAHIAQVNNMACSKVSGTPAPQTPKLADTEKDKLVEALKASMDFCTQSFAKLTDANAGDQVPWFGGRQVSRISAALEVTNDLVDHYSSLALYLRLNSLLPPTAKRGD